MSGDPLFGPDGTQPAAEDLPHPDEIPTPPAWPTLPGPAAPVAGAGTGRAGELWEPQGGVPAGPADSAAVPAPDPLPPRPHARPRIEETEPSLFGLTRRSRTRTGSRVFTIVFLAIFLLILLQVVAQLLSGTG